MPGKLPKYAHWVAERRFVVDASRLPPLDLSAARTIEDLYIDGGRLRLRRITHAATGEQEWDHQAMRCHRHGQCSAT